MSATGPYRHLLVRGAQVRLAEIAQERLAIARAVAPSQPSALRWLRVAVAREFGVGLRTARTYLSGARAAGVLSRVATKGA